ncbi:MAG: hypothetical protein HY925_15305, partial [Elusimicrobia bacterium]|nr:hypothetical protein [Elusimicrobiota bacterium]
MDPKNAQRVMVAGVAALAVVVVAIGLQWSSRGGSNPPTGALNLSAPVQPQGEQAADEEDVPKDRLFETASSEDGELSFTELLGSFKDGARSPKTQAVADKFAAEFKAQPKLKEVYDDFKKQTAEGNKPKAAAFMARLRATEGFKELTTKFAGMPGSGALLMAAANQPKVKDFLLNDAARITGKAPPAARGVAGSTLRGVGAVAAGRTGSGGRYAALAGDLKGGAGSSGGATGGNRTTAEASAAGPAGGGLSASGAGAQAPGA